MSLSEEPSARGMPWSRTGASILVLGFCVALVSGMALLVLREIDTLSSANSDNLQWSLAQADVEYMQFRLALEYAEEDPSSLKQVRRRFDIFYSRMATFETGTVYQGMRDTEAFNAPRTRVQAFLTFAVPLIDAGDTAMLAALPTLEARADAIAGDVRNLTLAGLGAFADASDTQRSDVTGTLLRLAVILAVVLAGLLLLAMALWRLNRLATLRADELNRTAVRMRTIVETSLDAIVLSDAEGRIREFNTAAQKIFGYTRDEARCANMVELLFTSESRERLILNARKRFGADAPAGSVFDRTLEVSALARGGRSFPAEISFDRAEGQDGPMYVAFIRDISRRRAAEESLTEARDRALAGERTKAEFLAVMSHEMRTPLNGLLGTMQLLRDHSMTRAQSDLLDHMSASGQLLLGLVNDVLDLAKFEAGKLTAEREPLSLPRLLDGIVETMDALSQANGNSLTWRWASAPQEWIAGDARRLRQVLLNLVGNAVKFTRDGRIEIEAEVIGFRDPVLELRVMDSGSGIAEADLGRIFQDFETLDSSYARQVGGTGLGLGIVRRLVGLMGGTVGAESELGEGSVFWIRIPLIRAAAQQPAGAPRIGRPASSPRPALSILLVEDNEINRFVASQMLSADGHEVTEARDGRAGVDLAEARAFDVILMDISMPVMDGQQAARIIRSGQGPCARTPIIAVTAHALPEEIARFHEAGMACCISKPLERDALLASLDIAMGHGAPADAVQPVPPIPAAEVDRLLDTAHLERLWIELPGSARDVLLERFIRETEADLTWFEGRDNVAQGLQAQAHKIAGSCAAFGLKALRQQLGLIEAALKAGQVPSQAQLDDLAPLWLHSRTALEHWVAQAHQSA